jgi:hypothetical protein
LAIGASTARTQRDFRVTKAMLANSQKISLVAKLFEPKDDL